MYPRFESLQIWRPILSMANLLLVDDLVVVEPSHPRDNTRHLQNRTIMRRL